ncbi:dihydroorotase [Candidatus Magnetaquicoccus inordinatus]|uniref:dihydroorotase n=1 Tax=Candidatus Magnetaquicoccus inordinatus TaxID=2496818 RepID=UPI00187D1629|nr:dihydroorotase [Candidatus Magnetaquicoccus inordinatus]
MYNPSLTESILIRGGRVIDPAHGRDETADVLIVDGVIQAVGRLEFTAQCRVIEAEGLVVAPGLVDMHVHLREPGQEYKEDIASGTRAAAAGGVTSVACMPNTQPVADDLSVIGYIQERARQSGVVRVFPVGAITKGLQGQVLTEMGLLQRAGCVAFSDDGRPVSDSGVMRKALEYSRMFSALLIQHAEEPSLSGGCMHEGIVSSRLGLPGIPSESESVMVDRDIRLVALTGGRYHVAHLSTRQAVVAVEQARRQGLPVSCEVTPHHFSLTDEAVIGYDTDAKMSPPLRSTTDRQALLDGLAQGVITVIATDHAPHDEENKRVEFCRAANGVIGLETLLPVSLELVRDGVMSLSACLAAMSCHPARLLGIPHGTLEVGRAADVVLFDPEESWIVDARQMQSKSKNSCFHGRRVKGRVKQTLVAGRVVYTDEGR